MNTNISYCLNKSPLQKKLKISSIFFISVGGSISFFAVLLNILFILFFIKNKKTKRSPLCIYLFFLSIAILIRLAEFYLSALVKLQIIDTENEKYILEYKTATSNDYICKWFHFMSRFSTHMSVYLVLLIQFQRFLTIRNKMDGLNLLLYNHALGYFICVALILVIFIIDEFYLFDNYFITIVYCPLTLIYSCVVNDKFKLLQSIKFDTNVYHHVHTIVYNIIPLTICIFLNLATYFQIKKRNKTIEHNRQRAISAGSNSVNSCNSREKSLKRIRLSSTNSSYSPNRNYSRIIRRPQKTVIFSKMNVIFLYQSDITCICILATFIQILSTIPTNMLSYLTEFDGGTIENVVNLVGKNNKLNENETFSDEAHLIEINLHFFYILLGILDMFSFNFYLLYSILSSKSLFKELKHLLLSFLYFSFN